MDEPFCIPLLSIALTHFQSTKISLYSVNYLIYCVGALINSKTTRLDDNFCLLFASSFYQNPSQKWACVGIDCFVKMLLNYTVTIYISNEMHKTIKSKTECLKQVSFVIIVVRLMQHKILWRLTCFLNSICGMQ